MVVSARRYLVVGGAFAAVWAVVCSSSVWIAILVGGVGSQVALAEPMKGYAGAMFIGGAIGLYCGAIIGVAHVVQLHEAPWRLRSWVVRNAVSWALGVWLWLVLVDGMRDTLLGQWPGALLRFIGIGFLVGSTTSLAQWQLVRSHGKLHWFLIAGMINSVLASLAGAAIQLGIDSLMGAGRPGDEAVSDLLFGVLGFVVIWGFLDGVRIAYWQRALSRGV